MTNDSEETQVAPEPVRKSKRADPATSVGPGSDSAPSTSMQDPIFERLVAGEADVVGLLAYSLSKQNKRDWLAAFARVKGRDPDAAEIAAFDIGETIDRRVATYRKLAEAAISGDSFWASSSATPVSEMSVPPPTATAEQAVSPPVESMAAFSPPQKGKDGWFIKRR